MNKHDHKRALNALKYLLEGTTMEGLKFEDLTLLLSGSRDNSSRIDGEIYLMIESKFQVYDSMPETVPLLAEMPALGVDASIEKLVRLRMKEIVNVQLGEETPHLLITFNTGEVLFVWGYNGEYENWEAGVYDSALDEELWLIASYSNDEITLEIPKDIQAGKWESEAGDGSLLQKEAENHPLLLPLLLLRKRKGLRNSLLAALFALLVFLPGQSALTDVAYIVFLFFIAYLSAYFRVTPVWKGFLYSLTVVAIVVAAVLTAVTIFPHIPELLVVAIAGITAFLSITLIG